MSHDVPGGESHALRLLIANVPPPLNEKLERQIQRQGDIQVIGRVQGYVEVLLAAQAGVDVVILSEEDIRPTPGICSHLLGEFPEVKILLLSPLADQAVLYWMGQRQVDLQFASADELLLTLRQLDALTNAT